MVFKSEFLLSFQTCTVSQSSLLIVPSVSRIWTGLNWDRQINSAKNQLEKVYWTNFGRKKQLRGRILVLLVPYKHQRGRGAHHINFLYQSDQGLTLWVLPKLVPPVKIYFLLPNFVQIILLTFVLLKLFPGSIYLKDWLGFRLEPAYTKDTAIILNMTITSKVAFDGNQ